MNDLIILIGTSGTGKTTVAEMIKKKGYEHLCFDKMVKELHGKGNLDLTDYQIKRTYISLGKKANEVLFKKPVVIDECFTSQSHLNGSPAK